MDYRLLRKGENRNQPGVQFRITPNQDWADWHGKDKWSPITSICQYEYRIPTTPSPWIAITDRRPKVLEGQVIYTDGRRTFIDSWASWYIKLDGGWTHWMPIPPLPKDEESAKPEAPIPQASSPVKEQAEISYLLGKTADRYAHEIAERREELVKAFLAQHGCLPDEAMICVHQDFRTFIRKMTPTERKASQGVERKAE